MSTRIVLGHKRKEPHFNIFYGREIARGFLPVLGQIDPRFRNANVGFGRDSFGSNLLVLTLLHQKIIAKTFGTSHTQMNWLIRMDQRSGANFWCSMLTQRPSNSKVFH